MKSVVIFYFSGTGNTQIMANLIREEFARHVDTAELINIEEVLKNSASIDIEKYDLVGIGCPVIGYSVPKCVKDFIGFLPREKGKKVFIFRTAGGVAPINYNASKPMIRKLKRKGYAVFYERVFSLGSNWIKKFDDAVVRQLYEAAKKKVMLMCQEILRCEERILKTGAGLKVRMELAGFVFSKLIPLIGKDYTVDPSCTHCGLCIKKCPSGNIYRKGGKIKFKWSCNSCMRCVYTCPRKAIRFKILKFFPVAGGYDIQKVLSEPSGCQEEIRGAVPPFFHGYIQNDAL